METYRDIDITKTWVMQGTLHFTRYFFKKLYKRKFIVGDHHRAIAAALDRVLKGEINRLIINVAPRYGKTELAIKNFIAEGFAINPAARFIHLSYSDDLARDNSRGVQQIMRSEEYRLLFPQAQPTSVSTRKWETRAGGGMYAISSAGQVTGFGAGIVDKDDDEELAAEVQELEDFAALETEGFGGAIVIDDPIKPDDARSEQIREKINQKFETTIRNRTNSRRTPIIIIMQRLDDNDLCGYLERLEPDVWTVIKLPVIQQDPETGEEKALWPFKHTLEELHELREKNAFVFDTQYMQNPRPLEGLMYERGFRTYTEIPATKYRKVKNYTDTADTGTDYLCSITYVETDIANYVLDVYYTDKPMEVTESETARRITNHGVQEAIIESNNGGRSFARKVEEICRTVFTNRKTAFRWFFQDKNKNERIFHNSNEVQNLTYFPEGWEHLWPKFYEAITHFSKIGRNAHDDAPDALTGTIEFRKDAGRISAVGVFH